MRNVATPFPFTPDFADLLFQQRLSSPMACALLLDKPASGVLMAVAMQHAFGMGRISSESLWYILPEARGRGGIRMLDPYEAWARSFCCVAAGLASRSNKDVSRL
jgi:hypothetical protein